MEKTKRGLVITVIVLFLYYILLVILHGQNIIANIQVYTFVPIIPLLFWIVFILLNTRFIIADIGFLKLGAVIGAAFGFMMISTFFTDSRFSYDTIKTNDYTLVLEYEKMYAAGSYTGEHLTVYKQINFAFSKEVGQINIAPQYETQFAIENDQLVVTKCTTVSCNTTSIPLQ